MKKFLSIALSLCLLFASLSGALVFPASALTEYVEVFSDDFESTEVGNFGTKLSTDAWSRRNADDNTGVIEETGGNKALSMVNRVFHNLNGILKEEITYKITFKLKLAPDATSTKDLHVRFYNEQISNYDKDSTYTDDNSKYFGAGGLSKRGVNSESWTELTVYYTYTSQDKVDGNTVLSFIDGQAAPNYLIDDVSVYCAEAVCPDFSRTFEEDTQKVINATVVTVTDSNGTSNKVVEIDEGKTGRFLINPVGTPSISEAGYTAGTKAYLRLTYRNLSNASGPYFILRMVNTQETANVWQSSDYKTVGSNISAWQSAEDIAAGAWSTKTVEITIPEDFDASQHLAFQIVSANHIQFDNIVLFRKAAITLADGTKEKWILPEVDADAAFYGGTAGDLYNLSDARVNDIFKFKLDANLIVNSVTYDDEVVTPDTDGVYKIREKNGAVLAVDAKEITYPDLYQTFEEDTQKIVGSAKVVTLTDEYGASNKVLEIGENGVGRALINPVGMSTASEVGYTVGTKLYIKYTYRNMSESADTGFYLRMINTQETADVSSGHLQMGTGWMSTWQNETDLANDAWNTRIVELTIPETFDPSNHIAFQIVSDKHLQIDNVVLFRKTAIKVNGINEKYVTTETDSKAVIYGGKLGDKYDFSNARVNDEFKFKFNISGLTVTYGDTVVIPDEDGVYTITVQEGLELTVTAPKLDTDLNKNETENTKKVLAIGNSYTEDVTALLGYMAEVENVDLRVARVTIGGCTLKTHSDNIANNTFDYNFAYEYAWANGKSYTATINKVSLQQALTATDWDYVTIQQASAKSATDNYVAEYLEPAQNIVACIKELAPNAEIVIHETWAYSTYNNLTSDDEVDEEAFATQNTMFKKLESNYVKLSEDLGDVRIIPVGKAVQLVRAEIGDILNRDNDPGHLNYLGRLTGAYTYFTVLTGSFPETFNPVNVEHSEYYNKFMANDSWVTGQYFKYSVSEKYAHDDGTYEDVIALTTSDVENAIEPIKQAVKDAIALYSNATFGKLNTAYNNAAALRTSENSSTGKNGLRIYNEIKKDWFNENNIVEFGSIAIRKGKLDGAELTVNSTGAVAGVAFRRGEIAMTLWATTDNSYIFTAYLSNMAEEMYDGDIVVRTYAKDADGNVYYGEIVTVSIYQVANAIDNGLSISGNEPSEVDKTAFYAFVNSRTYSDYKAWCETNDKNIGALYNDKYAA